MEGNLEISLDKLPVKRLEAIEENGLERFPADVGYDEKRVSLIRRIDFARAVEEQDGKQKKKQKKSSKESSTPWQWQSMVENLQLAHQELSVIVDLINTVEANDAVTVAGMTRPKLLPNEVLSDLSVSAATKLQCYRHLGKYFKQSAKALEQQITREARFYGALIRLQQNWKVKRQRVAASAPSNEGFTIDLFDGSLYNAAAVFRPSPLSLIRVDHDSAGMLTINLPQDSCRSLHFGFVGVHSTDGLRMESDKKNNTQSVETSREIEKQSLHDDDSIKKTHSLLREVHKSIFSEQVFEMVNREACNQSLGVNVTGIQENYLQMSVGQGTSVFISIVPSNKSEQTVDNASADNLESAILPSDSFDGLKFAEGENDTLARKFGFPNRTGCEIYLQQIFHEYVLEKAKDTSKSSTITRASVQPAKDVSGLLGHFCLSLAHRIFSNRVLVELENVVCRVSYLHLISHPTWHSRTSSWTLFMKVPQSILHASAQAHLRNTPGKNNIIKSQFRTKVVVNDDRINVEGECAPNIVRLFKGNSDDLCSVNKYDCNLADLPVMILQQVASQVIRWLHEEALMVGIKANCDFLCLSFELDQGETVSLVAHVDPEDIQGCISWWLVMDDGFAEERKLTTDVPDGASDYRKFLGHLSLDVLYSTLMDLVSLCSGGGS